MNNFFLCLPKLDVKKKKNQGQEGILRRQRSLQHSDFFFSFQRKLLHFHASKKKNTNQSLHFFNTPLFFTRFFFSGLISYIFALHFHFIGHLNADWFVCWLFFFHS